MPISSLPIIAPTIASLKAAGLTGVLPVCRACHHSGAATFDAIGLPDETPFPRIARARRFRCSGCGARDYAVVPDWSRHRAPGTGRMWRNGRKDGIGTTRIVSGRFAARKSDWEPIRELHQGLRHEPRTEAGHMTAPDQPPHAKSLLQCRSRPHMTHGADNKWRETAGSGRPPK